MYLINIQITYPLAPWQFWEHSYLVQKWVVWQFREIPTFSQEFSWISHPLVKENHKGSTSTPLMHVSLLSTLALLFLQCVLFSLQSTYVLSLFPDTSLNSFLRWCQEPGHELGSRSDWHLGTSPSPKPLVSPSLCWCLLWPREWRYSSDKTYNPCLRQFTSSRGRETVNNTHGLNK